MGWKTSKTGTQLGATINITKNTENSGVTREEAFLLMTNKQEWRSWIAQCARHGMD